jgi:hypothetical protein
LRTLFTDVLIVEDLASNRGQPKGGVEGAYTAMYSERWIQIGGFDNGGFGYWVLAGFTQITSESKTRHSQSMNNFPLNTNSEYSVN